MTREELIRNVALKMDEISSSDDVVVSVHAGDNNPLYAQIDGLLNESINEVLMKAPIYRLNQFITLKTFDVYDSSLIIRYNAAKTRKIAVLALPSDFLRFISITDSIFQRPITELHFLGDDVDKRQHNKHLIAKEAKPVAVMTGCNNSGENAEIHCYSYPTETQIPNPNLLYICRFNSQDTSSLNDYMIDAVSWVCAGKVFATRGDTTNSKTCDENAVAIMI
jgi:hypothetical protein